MRGTGRGAGEEAPPVLFGFWIFLMSDMVLFALLFATYASMSVHSVAGGPAPEDVVDLTSAGIETALLLTSSFTFGLASLALKYRDATGSVLMWLGVTAVLGLAFVGMEIHDFALLVDAGSVPQRSGFLSAYFTLLATHGLHVSAGLIWLAVMVVQILVQHLGDAQRLRLMRLALFWHMLDIVWIGIFTFVFLFGVVA